jgi:ergothioneine biosynthesis protein EgtC
MCRLLVYRGRDILMSDLLTRAEQSLIRQSFRAREREEPLNGDGFGVGWYAPDIDPTPCVFTSVRPAWSNRNLHRLAEKVRAGCFFAHVRAASSGMSVSEANCHPFQHGRFLWMHNGRVAGFGRIKRALRALLKDEFYDFIEGTTDSEHAFALFLNNLSERSSDYSLEDMEEAMLATIAQLNELTAAAGVDAVCRYNFALTDGSNVLITRYTTAEDESPETLYIARGSRFERAGSTYRMVHDDESYRALIIASEPLTDDRGDWQGVARNHMLAVHPDLSVESRPIAV